MNVLESELIDAIAQRLVALLKSGADRQPPVQHFAGPQQLETAFSELGVPLALDADQAPVPAEALESVVEAVAHWSVQTLHPRFFGRGFAGADPLAVLGDWLGAVLNTTAATYEAAPVFTLMERALCVRLAALAGWSTHEGVFLPGGASSVLHALHLARHRASPAVFAHGNPCAGRLVAFTSAESRGVLRKAMALTGLGTAALEVVPTDAQGRMDVAELERAIRRVKRQHNRPFFVNATAGTPMRGAFDPLEDIVDVAYFHDIWLHVDGGSGATALLADETAPLMAGVDRADSLSWSLHQVLGVTQQSTALLVRAPGLLRRAFGGEASGLFEPDRNHPELDTEPLVFHCGRRVDALKAWLTWKSRGTAGFVARIAHGRALARYAAAQIEADARFVLMGPPVWLSVVFWWVPPDLRPLDLSAACVRQRLAGVTPAIKDRLQRDGRLLLSYGSVADQPNAFRLLLVNPEATEADVDAALATIDLFGQALPHPV
jgi:glutamate/tyrosine decarboxylase-like PLP-dependent enzyme